MLRLHRRSRVVRQAALPRPGTCLAGRSAHTVCALQRTAISPARERLHANWQSRDCGGRLRCRARGASRFRAIAPEVIQSLRMRVRVSASRAASMQSTSTPSTRRRCVSASATPPLSGMMTTRLARSSFTPVGLQNVSGGRKVGTGTRRGIRSAASKLSRTRRSVALRERWRWLRFLLGGRRRSRRLPGQSVRVRT